MPRDLSVAFQGDKPLSAYGPLAARAEAGGFDAISVYADLGFLPAIGPLLEIARATSRVRIGPASLNPFLLHPVEIAGQMAMLDAASNGRAGLGLARGAWLEPLGLTDDRPLTRIRETVAVVRHILSGDEAPFIGERFRLPAGRLLQYPVRRPAIPVLIGSWGPRLLRLAGEIADEVKIGGSTNPDLVAMVHQHVADGERAAGRAARTVGICFGAVTVVDQDGAAARARARIEAARYLPVVAPLDPTTHIAPETLARMAALVDAGDEDGAGAFVPDDLLDRFAFSGTPDQVAAQAERLFAAGVTRVEFGTPHGLTEDCGLRLLCERVVPMLHGDSSDGAPPLPVTDR